MSAAFPTHRQFKAQIRSRIWEEYPDAEREAVNDTVALQGDEQKWLEHLGKLIEQGVPAERAVLDTLTEAQLYSLKKHYAPFEALNWYTPLVYRKKERPLVKCLTAEKLFEYALGVAKVSEESDQGTKYATFRQAADHFKVTLTRIEELCSEYFGPGYMGAVVAVRSRNGIGAIGRKADYQIEAYL